MAGDSIIQVPPDDAGRKVATYQKTEGGNAVELQKVILAGHTPDDDISPLSGTLPVSATSLPLPTGAAQEAGNLAATKTSVASIDTKTPAQGQALSSASSPVVLATDQETISGRADRWAQSQQALIAGDLLRVGMMRRFTEDLGLADRRGRVERGIAR